MKNKDFLIGTDWNSGDLQFFRNFAAEPETNGGSEAIFVTNETDFAARMGLIVEGFSRDNPLVVSAELYAQLRVEPALSHLMERFAVKHGRDFAMCAGKEHFESFSHANMIRQRMAIRQKKGTLKKRERGFAMREPYHCPVCGDWHLGRPDKPRKLRSKRRGA